MKPIINILKQKSHEKWFKLGIAALIAAPPLGLIVLLFKYAVNVPFWDQWELPVLLEKANAGTANFGDFFAQHNEHRIFFPRLIMVGLAFLSHWNTNYEVAASVVLAAIAFGFLWLLLRSTFTNKKVLLVAMVVVSLVFFSAVQQENWMWGWQVQWFTNILGLIVAVWALGAWRSKWPPAKILVAIGAAVFSTFSIASGIFVWLVCLPLLWFNKELRKFLPLWLGVAAVTAAIYYVGYQDPGGASKLVFLHEPVAFVVYLLVYYARPLVVDFLVSLPVAFVYLTTAATNGLYLFRHFKTELTTTLLPWLCIGGYALLAGLTTDLSRLGLGIEQAYSSRYTTLSSLLLVAVVVMAAKTIELTPKAAIRSAMALVLVVITLLAVINYAKGIQQMKQQHEHLLKVRQCAHTAQSADDDCLLIMYPNKQIVWPRLQYLRSIHWGGL